MHPDSIKHCFTTLIWKNLQNGAALKVTVAVFYFILLDMGVLMIAPCPGMCISVSHYNTFQLLGVLKVLSEYYI